MPRPPRSHLPDGYFHVTSRGVGGSRIYVDDDDRERFARVLAEVVRRFEWGCHAWCQMGTHYHLLVHTSRHRLSAGMHRLNGLYAQGFNRRHDRRGHLFENRFSAWLLEDEQHFHASVAYILENPVRAGLCTDARDWLWSWPRGVRANGSPARTRL